LEPAVSALRAPWLSLTDTKAELGIPPSYAHRACRGVAITGAPPGKGASGHELGMANGEPVHSPEVEFDEPAAAEDREDLGTDVAPSCLDAPADPRIATRAPSPEGCSLRDEHRPKVEDFDATV